MNRQHGRKERNRISSSSSSSSLRTRHGGSGVSRSPVPNGLSNKRPIAESPKSVMCRLPMMTLTTTVQFARNRDGTIREERIIPRDNNFKPSSAMTFEEKKQIWWQEPDYDAFKKTARLIANEIRRRHLRNGNSHSHSSIIMRIYAVCCKAAREALERDQYTEEKHSEGEDHNDYPDEHGDGCEEGESDDFSYCLSDRDRFQLQQWVDVGICRRGLEKWIIPSVAKDRQRRKDIVIRSVLSLQERARMIEGFSQDEINKFIRKKSCELSRSSRIFARAMGEADSVVGPNDG